MSDTFEFIDAEYAANITTNTEPTHHHTPYNETTAWPPTKHADQQAA
ncbi:hypothetical protein [Actinopolymorpha pittospori]